MTFTTHCRLARGRIDPAPLVDVVFLLLIFLILSSPFVLSPGIGQIDLPVNSNPPSASFQGLVVTVTREQLLFYNNQRTTLAELPAQLRASAQGVSNPELIIKADVEVPHGTVMEITRLALAAGIPAVNLATRPVVGPSAPPAP